MRGWSGLVGGARTALLSSHRCGLLLSGAYSFSPCSMAPMLSFSYYSEILAIGPFIKPLTQKRIFHTYLATRETHGTFLEGRIPFILEHHPMTTVANPLSRAYGLATWRNKLSEQLNDKQGRVRGSLRCLTSICPYCFPLSSSPLSFQPI